MAELREPYRETRREIRQERTHRIANANACIAKSFNAIFETIRANRARRFGRIRRRLNLFAVALNGCEGAIDNRTNNNRIAELVIVAEFSAAQKAEGVQVTRTFALLKITDVNAIPADAKVHTNMRPRPILEALLNKVGGCHRGLAAHDIAEGVIHAQPHDIGA